MYPENKKLTAKIAVNKKLFEEAGIEVAHKIENLKTTSEYKEIRNWLTNSHERINALRHEIFRAERYDKKFTDLEELDCIQQALGSLESSILTKGSKLGIAFA